MIRKHEVDKNLSVAATPVFKSFFTEVNTLIKSFIDLDKEIMRFLEEDGDPYDVYDVMDDLEIVDSNIKLIAECRTSVINANNKYLAKTVDNLKVLENNINTLVLSGRAPDESDAKILHRELFSVIGGLTYFITNDFGILDVANQIMEGVVDIEIDEVLDSFIKSNSLNLKEYCITTLGYFTIYKYHLELFDEYPELENQFEEVVGPDYNLIPEGSLTKEVVLKIISGELNIEDFLKQFENLGGDE